ncbi:putative sporulation protein YyaC [Alkalihalobacillus xiaoxiensis]|uniref:Sporulation protein YyaC n=1 Tax=Shouchella xiaoxiensis TaxID=766895 RepID=A0ABS2T142_9BACI|nr:spore protease YyaC [Shouchella xiaoxiensis]MBM7840971.1 putative sporulation protein YyaC [Shouchella xiaoxiensis]
MNRNLWPFKKRSSYRFHVEHEQLIEKLSDHLLEYCRKQTDRELIVVCIGTDRSTGDALGPLLGTMLATTPLNWFHVYGTLAEPIHAINLVERLNAIQILHPDAYIIAVDACLGKSSNVGYLALSEGAIKPGAAMGKDLQEVGDLSLTGIVNVGGMMDFYMLQSTRLHVVMDMAEKMNQVIQQVDDQLSQLFTSFPTKQRSVLSQT